MLKSKARERAEPRGEPAKAGVVGREGVVDGDITTQDAVISGRVRGTITVGSRLEVNATAQVEGEIHIRRMVLEEGATLNGTVHMGRPEVPKFRQLRGARQSAPMGGRRPGIGGSPPLWRRTEPA